MKIYTMIKVTPNFFDNQKRYKKYYKQILCQNFILKQHLKNIMELPKIKKIVLNTTSKYYVSDKKNVIPALLALQLISGQKLKYTQAKKSIAMFKLRQNQIIGCKTTLRGKKMYQFLEKFVTYILPRLREFSNLDKKSLDNKGNFTLGIKNLLIFPELENYFEFFEFIQGMDITFVISNTENSNKKNYSHFFNPISLYSDLPNPNTSLKNDFKSKNFKQNDKVINYDILGNKINSVLQLKAKNTFLSKKPKTIIKYLFNPDIDFFKNSNLILLKSKKNLFFDLNSPHDEKKKDSFFNETAKLFLSGLQIPIA